MQTLADALISLIELIEAEGRVLRLRIAHLFLALVVLTVGGIMATAGVLMLIIGLYHTLEPMTGRVAAYAISGFTAIIASGALLAGGLKIARGGRETNEDIRGTDGG